MLDRWRGDRQLSDQRPRPEARYWTGSFVSPPGIHTAISLKLAIPDEAPAGNRKFTWYISVVLGYMRLCIAENDVSRI